MGEVVRYGTAMGTRWRSYCAVTTLPCSNMRKNLFYMVTNTYHCRSSMSFANLNLMVWQTCFLVTNHYASFELTQVLIFCFSTPTWHYIRFHVSTLLGSYAHAEQGISLALLVIQEASLLDLWVCHLSGNVIIYWWYTDLHLIQAIFLGFKLFTNSSVVPFQESNSLKPDALMFDALAIIASSILCNEEMFELHKEQRPNYHQKCY